MDSKTIVLTALSGGLIAAAMSGQVQPRVFLEDGSVVRSWAEADSSSLQVVDVQPSAGGWLKLLLGLGGAGAGVSAIAASYKAEERAS